ncbi:hypothetical protein KGP36_02010 [Patescibacteria group bacterium]|nr:hypothetical protein [Patescibacteria group bacterium]
MTGDYRILSPSLEGVLSGFALTYEGLKRPIEVLQLFEGPACRGADGCQPRPEAAGPGKQKVLERYFDDLYRVFMKRLSYFVVGIDTDPGETVRLQAMLQEMIKIKGFMSRTGL